MKSMTATEVIARRKEYEPVLAEMGKRLGTQLQRVGYVVHKQILKSLIKVATNHGPILGYADTFIIVGRLSK